MRLDDSERCTLATTMHKRRRTKHKLLLVAFYEPDDGGELKKVFFLYIVHHTHSQFTLRECFSFSSIQYICKLVRMWKTKMLSNQSGLHIIII